MAVSLGKGQGISLKKTENNLSQVTIGLGWDIQAQKKSFLGLFGGNTADYDLDVIAFLVGANGKVNNLGRDAQGNVTLQNGDVVFFNNQYHGSGHIWLTGDNRTGAGDGDDEQIIVKLNDLSQQYHKVVFVVQIYKAVENKQHFGQVNNAFIRAVDATGKEMVRFDLSGTGQYEQQRSLLFAELVRETSGWSFNAVGQASSSDSFVEWLKHYA
ncbi:MAG: TerD family protein [Acinetobacter sp.]|jgi:stress response protein SCP2|uniref:TerD family protein n=1 Tax=Acinetobacter sp. TaxID=472 RepID=UPI000FB9885D|nr:TerD family protein [Acinetobacter sp.]MBP9788196.1 TerD family protein [Acinetobacter sp.]RUP41808.1 MAG: TerD family protein [Acinetobacter sp.]